MAEIDKVKNQTLQPGEIYGLYTGPSRILVAYIGEHQSSQENPFVHRFVGPGVSRPMINVLHKNGYIILNHKDRFMTREGEGLDVRVVLGVNPDNMGEGEYTIKCGDYIPEFEPLPNGLTQNQVDGLIEKIEGARQIR
jgi:hypothetical protein